MTSQSSLDYQKRQKVGLDDLSPQKCFSAMFSLDAIIDNMYFNPGGSYGKADKLAEIKETFLLQND